MGSKHMNPRGLLTRAWGRAERLGSGVRGRDTEIHRLGTRPGKGGEGSPGQAAGLAPMAAVRTTSLPRGSLRGPNRTPAEGRGGDRRGDAGDAGLGAGLWNAAADPTFASRRLRESPSRPETGPRTAKSQWGRSGQRLRRRNPPPPGNPRSRESCRALPTPPLPRRGCRHSRPLLAGSLVRSRRHRHLLAGALRSLLARTLQAPGVAAVTRPRPRPRTALRLSLGCSAPTRPPWPGPGTKSGAARCPNPGKELRAGVCGEGRGTHGRLPRWRWRSSQGEFGWEDLQPKRVRGGAALQPRDCGSCKRPPRGGALGAGAVLAVQGEGRAGAMPRWRRLGAQPLTAPSRPLPWSPPPLPASLRLWVRHAGPVSPRCAGSDTRSARRG